MKVLRFDSYLLHEDQKPSARYNPEKATWYCDVCKKGGGVKILAEQLGIPTNGQKTEKIQFNLEETYRYELEPGIEYYAIDRLVSNIRGKDGKFEKKFRIKHRVDGQYIYKRDNLRIIPYHQPEIRAAKAAGIPIRDHEGEKKADISISLGLLATTMPFGANAKIEDSYIQELTGTEVNIYPDNDDPGEKYALTKAKALYGKAKVKIIHLPGLPPKGDIVDFINAGGTKQQILKIEAETPEFKRTTYTIDDILNIFKGYYFLPDTGHIELFLATIATNLGSGDPVWLLLVAPPGWGKTEPTNSVIGLPYIRPVATLTEASLLSGTPRKDRSNESKGGLLSEMGSFGILLIKDFSGILSLNRDSRSSILSALREIYDGSWTRYVGADGGRHLEWVGKAGLIGCATPSIDNHYSVMAILGERFCYYRLPELNEFERAEKALSMAGHESAIRNEINKMVIRFLKT